MTALLNTLPSHLHDLTAVEGTSLKSLASAPIVAISSVTFLKLGGYDGKRFEASLAATEAYTEAGVRQLVLFGDKSNYRVPQELARRGAIVVPTPRNGLATPYLDAAQLVRHYAGSSACVLKAEGDKLLTAASLTAIRDGLSRYDVVVGDRMPASMASMSPIQERTEALLDALLPGLLGIPHGASSGVQAYTPEGLKLFLRYEEVLERLGNNWKYLLYVPAMARELGLRVGSAIIDVAYDAEMVQAENTPALVLKRLEQLLLMLEGGYEISAMVNGDTHGYDKPDDVRLDLAQQQLTTLRELVTAG